MCGGQSNALGVLLRCRGARQVVCEATHYQSPCFITIQVFCLANLGFDKPRMLNPPPCKEEDAVPKVHMDEVFLCS